MKTHEIKINVTVYEDECEMSAEDQALLQAARQAAKRAYAVYSHFQVGAAILLSNGEVITGNNQENASYPLTQCAERTAAFYASAQYPDAAFKKIAITAINPMEELTYPATPCGACRQVLSEYERKSGEPIEVILAGQRGDIWKVHCINDLLPLSFGSETLPKS